MDSKRSSETSEGIVKEVIPQDPGDMSWRLKGNPAKLLAAQ